jgi:hypothetical protein
MIRISVAWVVGVVSIPLLVSPAQADGLGGISGWQPPPAICGEGNVVPLLFGNYTDETQTVTITVSGNMAEQVAINSFQSPNCPQRDGTGKWAQNGASYTQQIVVGPGQISAQSITLGGVDENLIGGNSFTMAGSQADPSADIGQWYSFALDLNADESFVSLQSSYFQTGGIDSTNEQNGFNILNCSPSVPTAGETVSIVGPVASPYSSGNTNGPKFLPGEAMCLGWIPEGEFISPDQVSNVMAATSAWLPVGPSVTGVQAAEYNATLNTVSMVLDATDVFAVRAVVDGQSVDLPNTVGAQGGFWGQDGDSLVIGGIPAMPQTQVLVLSGTPSQPYASFVMVPTSSTASDVDVTTYMPEDVSVTGSSSTPGVTVLSAVTGQSGLNALVYAGLSFNAQALSSIPGVTASTVATIQLISINGPQGFSKSYSQTLGQIGAGTPNTLAMVVSVPAASSVENLEDGNFLTGTYTANFAVYPGEAESDTPATTFTASWTVSAP